MAGELSMGVTEGGPKLVRVNGLHAPFDPLQILSWIIVALLAASFCGALSRLLPEPWDLVAVVAYSGCLAAVVGSGFETGRRDPIDPYVKMTEEELEGVSDLLKCSACRSRVNKLSRHCLICDKCVVDYDHHCRWLNNCIGADNYRTFIVLIASTMALIGIQLVASIFLFAKYVGDMDKLDADLRVSSVHMDSTLFFVLVCANGVLAVPVFMMVAHLVGFHIYLAYHGLTTYNYVMAIQAEEQRATAYLEDSDSDLSTEEEEEEEEEEEAGAVPLDKIVTVDPNIDKSSSEGSGLEPSVLPGQIEDRVTPGAQEEQPPRQPAGRLPPIK